jgi:O-antigen/teichoic acid export membrane protein
VPSRAPDAVPGDVLSGADVGARVVHGALQRSAGFVAVNLFTALAAVLLLRHLGVDDFGRFGTVMALLAIVQGISDAGLSMTGSRELSIRSDHEDRRDLLAHLLGLRIVLTGVGVLFAIGFAAVAGYGTTLVEGTALAGAGIFLLSVQAAMLLPLAVDLRNGRLTLNEMLRQGVLLVAYVALVIAGASLLPFFGAQLVSAVVVLGMTPLLLHRRHLVRPRWTRARLRELTVLTLPLAVSAVLSILYFRILVIVMSLLENDPRQVGYYVTSARIIEIFLGLPTILVGVVLPVLSVAARDDGSRLRYVTERTTQVLALLGVLLALGLGIGARPVVLILGGTQYEGAIGVLQIQCIALITIFITGAWTSTLVGMGKTRALAATTATGVLSVVVLGVALVPPFGAKGAAVAAVLADLLLCGATYLAMRHSGLRRVIPVSTLGRVALAALPPLALGVLSPLPAIVNAILAGALFCVLALVLDAVPSEVAERLPLPRSRVR